ncbi:MAG: MFS transporter [Pseudomonadota bacterium]
MSSSAIRVIIAGSLIVAIAMGIRQAFGVFLAPVSQDLETGRQVFGLAMATQNLLWGLLSPFAGIFADRYGAVPVTIFGTLCYIAGLVLTTMVTGPIGLNLSLGLLIGIGLAASTYVTAFGAVGRVVDPAQRSLALGIVTSLGSFGMFVAAPAAHAVLSVYGWVWAFMIMAGILVASLLAAPALATGKGKTQAGPSPVLDPTSQTALDAIREAGRHSGYLLLTAGFFVCGFHVTFIGVHFVAHLTDSGLSGQIGSLSLALIGLFNIVGSFLFGQLGGTYSKKYMLSGIYLARSVVILVFILLPVTAFSSLAFAAAIGFLWLATVPLTSGLVAQIFGVKHMSMLYGVVFASHQVGAFLGAWLGGYFYDTQGSYDAVWWASIVLGLVAALLHWPIADRPVARLQAATR